MKRKKRPDQTQVPVLEGPAVRRDPREAAKPAAAHKMQQDRLRPVVRMMGNRNAVRAGLRGHPRKFAVPHGPAGLLDADALLLRERRHIHRYNHKRNLFLFAKCPAERLVALRLRAADLMVDVHRGKPQRQLLRKLVKHHKKAQRVASAGKSGHNAVSG